MKEEVIDGIKYRLDEENLTAEVTYKEEAYEGDIVIPETVKFDGVSYRVTSIGDQAFDGCSSLTEITIPDSVVNIGWNAFDDCDSLKQKPTQEIKINEITYRLLKHNHLAKVVSLSCSEDLGAIDILSEITYEGVVYRVTSIGEGVFCDCESTAITIPNSIISIGDEAFCNCESLTVITIPDSVISIGERAFCGCDSLTEIVVEEGNPVYDSRDNCNAIIEKNTNTLICGCQSTIIPDSVTCIGDEAFKYCNSLISITIPESVTSIGDAAFWGCESLTVITIPDSVISIGERAFWGCESLTSVILGNSVKSIGNFSFSNCKSLTSITIPDTVTCIGDRAFQSCCKLADLTISDGVTTIGTFVFKDCKALTSVTIPSSVKSIGEGGTFQGCTSLKLVQWNAVNCIIDENSNGNYYPPFYNLSSIKNFTFGNNVKFIPACLCCGLSGLTSILIPESVTSIGVSAFKGCTSLKAIDIPDSVMIIEEGAFYGCTSLKIISIPSNAIIIEDGVFSECKSLYVIRYRGTVEQCIGRYLYWGSWFHAKTIYCTDDDKTVYF